MATLLRAALKVEVLVSAPIKITLIQLLITSEICLCFENIINKAS